MGVTVKKCHRIISCEPIKGFQPNYENISYSWTMNSLGYEDGGFNRLQRTGSQTFSKNAFWMHVTDGSINLGNLRSKDEGQGYNHTKYGLKGGSFHDGTPLNCLVFINHTIVYPLNNLPFR